MKILITGYKGFIGQNLVDILKKHQEIEVLPFDKDSAYSLLVEYTQQCDFVFHLAAVHRPKNIQEFDSTNRVFFEEILNLLKRNENSCPVVLTSSIHAGYDSDYGKSKIAAEHALQNHSELMRSKAIIYRLTNTFGRYALPNHYSVVATFCYNISNNLPVIINEPNRIMRLYYIDDVITSFISHFTKRTAPDSDGIYRLPKNQMYSISLHKLSEILFDFKTSYDLAKSQTLLMSLIKSFMIHFCITRKYSKFI